MIVLDANAAIAIMLETDDGKALRSLALKGEKACAPTLFHAELTHTLEKYARGDRFLVDTAVELYEQGLSLVDEFIPDEELAVEALKEAVRLKHSSYDMLYFVLARRTNATLFTLDRKLASLCEEQGVECIHHIPRGE